MTGATSSKRGVGSSESVWAIVDSGTLRLFGRVDADMAKAWFTHGAILVTDALEVCHTTYFVGVRENPAAPEEEPEFLFKESFSMRGVDLDLEPTTLRVFVANLRTIDDAKLEMCLNVRRLALEELAARSKHARTSTTRPALTP